MNQHECLWHCLCILYFSKVLVELTKYFRIHTLRFFEKTVKYGAMIKPVFGQDPVVLCESGLDLCTDRLLVLGSGGQVVDSDKNLLGSYGE